MFSPTGSKAKKPNDQAQQKTEDGGRDLHIIVWNSNTSLVSNVFGGGGHEYEHRTRKRSLERLSLQGKVALQYIFVSSFPFQRSKRCHQTRSWSLNVRH
ncbi:hypothetical protein V6N13_016572 [Hibiscus sabdariffa]